MQTDNTQVREARRERSDGGDRERERSRGLNFFLLSLRTLPTFDLVPLDSIVQLSFSPFSPFSPSLFSFTREGEGRRGVCSHSYLLRHGTRATDGAQASARPHPSSRRTHSL